MELKYRLKESLIIRVFPSSLSNSATIIFVGYMLVQNSANISVNLLAIGGSCTLALAWPRSTAPVTIHTSPRHTLLPAQGRITPDLRVSLIVFSSVSEAIFREMLFKYVFFFQPSQKF